MTESRADPRNPVFEGIASRYRREGLLALNRWGPTMATRQLAEYLAATADGTSSPSATEIGAMHTRLAHVHLPALEAVDLVSWDREKETVRTTAHPALDDPRFEQVLEIRVDGLDAILSALSHEYRRIALTVLEAERTTSRAELAHEVRHRLPETVRSDLSSSEEIERALHHVHLPKLDEIGVIEFDSAGQVSYVDHPALESVFAVIFERNDSAIDKLDGFLDGLADSYREANRGTNSQVDWPHFWSDPYNG